MQEFDIVFIPSEVGCGISFYRGDSTGKTRHMKFRSVQDLRRTFSHLGMQPAKVTEIEKICLELEAGSAYREKMFLPENVFELLDRLPAERDGTVRVPVLRSST